MVKFGAVLRSNLASVPCSMIIAGVITGPGPGEKDYQEIFVVIKDQPRSSVLRKLWNGRDTIIIKKELLIVHFGVGHGKMGTLTHSAA